ncbi:MAG: DUF350 domain-containing protein [Myxococcales bacterium]|nr:DUF350 domain-containing protein [Myxococcales bacterium]
MSLELVYTLAALLLVTGLLLLGRVAWSRLAGFDAEAELTTADNPAVGTALFGYLAGLLVVLIALLTTDGATSDDPVGMAWDLGEVALYGVLAIALLKLSGVFNDRFILHRFENKKELVGDRNAGVGAVLCGSYLASGLILAGAFSGRVDLSLLPEGASRAGVMGQEILIGLAYFAFCQVALAIFGLLYQAVQKVNVHSAIADDYEQDGVRHGGNFAAGLAFGGNLAALGLVMWGGARHDFTGWTDAAFTLGLTTGVGLLLLPLWRIFVDRVMLSRADLNHEIYSDRNVNAALLETISVLGLAAVIAVLA